MKTSYFQLFIYPPFFPKFVPVTVACPSRIRAWL